MALSKPLHSKLTSHFHLLRTDCDPIKTYSIIMLMSGKTGSPCQVMLWICWAKTACKTLLKRLWVCPRRKKKMETFRGTSHDPSLTNKRSIKKGPHIKTQAAKVNHWWWPITWKRPWRMRPKDLYSSSKMGI